MAKTKKKGVKDKTDPSVDIKIKNFDKIVKGCKTHKNSCNPCSGGGFYFLGFLGAAIYYISTASGFWMGVLGFLKAIIWPVFVVHGLMKFLGL